MEDWQRILVAVNDSDDALRAVRYVGEVASITGDVRLYLLFIYPDPPPDYFSKGGTLDAYKEIMEYQGRQALDLAVESLKKYGVSENNITRDIQLADGKTISEVILSFQKEHSFHTLVVGKRGISKNEEFLFGSISNTIARKTKGFTTWIVG